MQRMLDDIEREHRQRFCSIEQNGPMDARDRWVHKAVLDHTERAFDSMDETNTKTWPWSPPQSARQSLSNTALIGGGQTIQGRVVGEMPDPSAPHIRPLLEHAMASARVGI